MKACAFISLCLEKPVLFACPGTVANNFGDYWAVNLAFSYVITYTLVHSGKQTHTVFVSIEVVGRGVGRETSWVMEMISFLSWMLCLVC